VQPNPTLITQIMKNFPDFSKQGYQVQKELGHNRSCGRVTYLAVDTKTYLPVVIKQFQFAQLGASWADYETVEKEIKLLRHLNHPSIPRYVNSFQTPSGFCLVQEYKQAPSLAQPRYFNPKEVKEIAIAILEVLVYLQQQNPPIIHRDIKPENILVDRQTELKVYLVDFGFAHIGSGEVAISSAVKGTLGFMPPEQLFNRQLTEASDLYSLGATLICLLTQTTSTKIGDLIDDHYQINFQHLVSQLNPEFIEWLEEIVAPNLNDRFNNAADALEVVKSIDVLIHDSKKDTNAALKFNKKAIPLIAFGAFSLLSFSAVTYSKITEENQRLKQVNFQLKDQVYNSKQSMIDLLLKTRQCPQCELGNTYLVGANLEKAALKGADLVNANLEEANLERADLAGANLQEANLKRTNLEGANLGYANLLSAKMEGADLRNANLWGAKLGGYVNFRGANLENANLGYAHLVGVYFGNANLKNVSLWGANLSGAFLGDAKLANAQLKDADLSGANLGDADLDAANLENAKLANAKLLGTFLENANLSKADLDGADLRGANLKGANLKGANLRGANLRGTNLQNANLEGANIREANLKGATMPDGSIYK
jgi:uncharacterized protein YjbI with pentapeptide repeats